MHKNISKIRSGSIRVLLPVLTLLFLSCGDFAGSGAVGDIDFGTVPGLYNGGAGLREFFLKVTVWKEDATVDFIVSANAEPADWRVVEELPAKYSRAFTKGSPREIYFSATDEYNQVDKRHNSIDLTKGEKTPRGFMTPGQTYYVHAYIAGKFASSSSAITLQNYPELPKQISTKNKVWAADVRPGKTYDDTDPSTYFFRESRVGSPSEMASFGAYVWGYDAWRESDGAFHEVSVRADEINFLPMRVMRPWNSAELGFTAKKDPDNPEDPASKNKIDPSGTCAEGTFNNIPVFQKSNAGNPGFASVWTWTEGTIEYGGAGLYSFRSRKAWFNNYGNTNDVSELMFAISNDNVVVGDTRSSGLGLNNLAAREKPFQYEFEISCLDSVAYSPKVSSSSKLTIYMVEK